MTEQAVITAHTMNSGGTISAAIAERSGYRCLTWADTIEQNGTHGLHRVLTAIRRIKFFTKHGTQLGFKIRIMLGGCPDQKIR